MTDIAKIPVCCDTRRSSGPIRCGARTFAGIIENGFRLAISDALRFHVPMPRGHAYLCAVMGWHSRKALGWAVSNRHFWNRYQRRLSLLKTLNYLGKHPGRIAPLCHMLLSDLPDENRLRSLLKYCCYDKQKRTNSQEISDRLHLT